MKIIDLLNKIANGEKIPKRIKFRGNILDYESEIDYKDNAEQYLFDSMCCINEEELNEEVEIIEDEEYKNEKILEDILKKYHITKEEFVKWFKEFINLIDKINEVK